MHPNVSDIQNIFCLQGAQHDQRFVLSAVAPSSLGTSRTTSTTSAPVTICAPAAVDNIPTQKANMVVIHVDTTCSDQTASSTLATSSAPASTAGADQSACVTSKKRNSHGNTIPPKKTKMVIHFNMYRAFVACIRTYNVLLDHKTCTMHFDCRINSTRKGMPVLLQLLTMEYQLTVYVEIQRDRVDLVT